MKESGNKDIILDYRESSDTLYLYHNPHNDKVTGNLVFRDGPIVDIGRNGNVLSLSVDNASKKLKLSPDEIKSYCEKEKVNFLFERALVNFLDIVENPSRETNKSRFYTVKILG